MADFETLLSPSNVLLYGRVLKDLTFTFQPPTPANTPVPRLGGNNFLQQQLFPPGATPTTGATLARIYAFAYEGQYYDLPRPMIFLVHGLGADPEGPRPGAAGTPAARFSRAPADADRTGAASEDYGFSDDMKVWSYDKGDFSLRMDVETGTFEQILLDAILMPESQSTAYSGAHTRLSGAHTRLSGAHTRLSGAHTRLSGKNRGGNWSD
jgi:hypothetical protein